MRKRLFNFLFLIVLLPLSSNAFASMIGYGGVWTLTDEDSTGFYETFTLSNPGGPGAGAVTSYSPATDSALQGSYIGAYDSATGSATAFSLTLDEISFTSGVSYSFMPNLYPQGFAIFDSNDNALLIADMTVSDLIIGTDNSIPSGKSSSFQIALSNMQAGAAYLQGSSVIIEEFLLTGASSIFFNIGDDLGWAIENSGIAPGRDNTYAGIATSVVPVPAALPLFISALGALGFIGWRRRRA